MMADLRTYNLSRQNAIWATLAIAPQLAPRAKPLMNLNRWTRGGSVGGLSAWRRAACSPMLSAVRGGLWRANFGNDSSEFSHESAGSEGSRSSLPKGFGPSKTSDKDKKRSSSNSTPPSSDSIRRAPPTKPRITAREADEQVLKNDSFVVTFLSSLFLVIIVEGLVLAASGFLPEKYDELVAKWLYPAFSPTLGVFFTIAAIYGLRKFLTGETSNGGS